MKKRREDGKIIEEYGFSDATKSEIAENKRYFLKGILKTYIPERTLYFLTPYDSPKIINGVSVD